MVEEQGLGPACFDCCELEHGIPASVKELIEKQVERLSQPPNRWESPLPGRILWEITILGAVLTPEMLIPCARLHGSVSIGPFHGRHAGLGTRCRLRFVAQSQRSSGRETTARITMGYRENDKDPGRFAGSLQRGPETPANPAPAALLHATVGPTKKPGLMARLDWQCDWIRS
jgi:hypothetical protein